MNYNPPPHRSECAALPKGWIREEHQRRTSGISGGRKTDVYYVSPSGKRIRSKPELLKILGSDRYDLTAFDYHSGKINPHLLRNVKSPQNQGKPNIISGSGKNINGRSNGGGSSSTGYDFARGIRTDATLVPPIRQTASIFKQPVTVHKVQRSGRSTEKNVSNPPKKSSSGLEKPRQIFWEKRLSGLRASYPDEEFLPFALPAHFRPVGPGVDHDILLASISTTLHLNSGTIRGQTAASKVKPDDNVSAFINPEQPLMSATSVTQEDVDRQEAKVNATRAKLAKTLESLAG